MPSFVFFTSTESESRMDLSPDTFANAVGYARSDAGRLFKNGAEYSVIKKQEVIEKLHFLLEQDGKIPSIRKLAAEANVGRGFAQKVLDELMVHGNVLDPKDRKKKVTYLPGARLLNFFDELVLLALQEQDLQRTLASYKTTLMQTTGASVSKSTISYWFKNRFEFKGSLRTKN
jgi:DNA-binding transcriptional regulator YhcF (GntR family)